MYARVCVCAGGVCGKAPGQANTALDGYSPAWAWRQTNILIVHPHLPSPLQLAAIPGCDPAEPFFVQDSTVPSLAPVPTLVSTHGRFCLPSMPCLHL